MALHFDSSSHTYRDEEGLAYESTTTFLGNQPEYKFDAKAVAEEVSRNERSKKYYGMNPQQIQEEWKKATEEGTVLHNAIEKWIKEGEEPLKEERAYYAVRQFAKGKWRGKLQAETMVWHKDALLAGTIDIITVQERKDVTIWTIYDIKTSRVIDEKKKEKYMMQMRIYKRLLEYVLHHKAGLGEAVEEAFAKAGFEEIPDKVEMGGIIWFPDYYKNNKCVIEYLPYEDVYEEKARELWERRNKQVAKIEKTEMLFA